MTHQLTDRVAVSGALIAADLRRLASEGFRSILDLRAHGEPRPQGLAPWEEEVLAASAGLRYRQIPVEPHLLSDSLGHAVRRALCDTQPPVLLHCTTGRRAGTFGLIALAADEALTVEQCLARGRAMGLDFDGMPRLTAFLQNYVKRHGKHYAIDCGDGRQPKGGAGL
ncbi:MAG TPA: sulfur transferase domain-containing protein [Candidatus Limnocylindria bacterium]|nr:sulfur transferase domain-containing protein [Candidatus Limnocylindria bacterium]